MRIIIDHNSMIPIYEQIINQIKSQVSRGELKENDSLPSVRSLSKDLRISALTVKKAYDRLEEEGFVVTIHGKGSYIAAANQELILEEQKKELEEELERIVKRSRSCGISDDELRDLLEIILEG